MERIMNTIVIGVVMQLPVSGNLLARILVPLMQMEN